MRYTLLILVLFLAACAGSKDAVYYKNQRQRPASEPMAEKRLSPIKPLKGTIEVSNSNAADLFSRSKLFFALMFKSYDAVVQLADDNSNTIIGSGTADIMQRYNAHVSFRLIVQTKNNYYRYQIDNIILHYKTAPLSDYYTIDLSTGERGSSQNVDWASAYDDSRDLMLGFASVLQLYMEGLERFSDFPSWQAED